MGTQKIFGEIFTRAEADKLYGPALESVKFKLSEFKNIIAKTEGYIMFKYEPGKLYIFDSKRNLIYSNAGDPKFGPLEVLKIYSMSVVSKLIETAENGAAPDAEPEVEVEKRDKVVTTSTSSETMEVAGDCPPDCPY